MPEVPAVSRGLSLTHDAAALSDAVAAAFAPGGPIALALPGFEARSGQLEMAEAVSEVFADGGILLAEAALGKAGITVNKNAIPFDKNPPMVASGIRVGTPAVTTRGMREPEMDVIGGLIARALASPEDDGVLAMVRAEVEALCRKFPLYPEA